jgi:hypothetical protein
MVQNHQRAMRCMRQRLTWLACCVHHLRMLQVCFVSPCMHHAENVASASCVTSTWGLSDDVRLGCTALLYIH